MEDSGKLGRDAGLDAVHRAEWQSRCLKYISFNIPKGWEGPFEELRARIIQAPGFYPPHHPNAWGAVSMNCIRHGILEVVEVHGVNSRHFKTNHARRAQILRKLV